MPKWVYTEEMRSFVGFNDTHGDICPVCKTAADVETVLVPLPDTELDVNAKARQVHRECLEVFLKMSKIAEHSSKTEIKDVQ